MYEIDGILHYAVDHTPSLFHRSFLEDCGPICAHYLDILIADGNDPVLQEANILKDGVFTNNDIFVYLQMLENNNILFKNKMAENDWLPASFDIILCLIAVTYTKLNKMIKKPVITDDIPA